MVEPSNAAIALSALMKLKRVGRRTALGIVDCALSSNSVSEVRDSLADRVARAKLPVSEFLEAWSQAADDLERSFAAGVKAYAFHDARYPQRLKNIPDPPAVLFVKGDENGLAASYCLAVIGTREPTSYGEKVARKLAATAAENGFAIISGLAHGCDKFGHEGCLDARGVGVAVLAHGLDKVFPAANRDLAERLLENGGCLVSEYPLGVTPMRTAFAERDRIQSGLSDGVLVVETDEKGGTMHTVRFSRAQHRALACIDHPVALRHEDKTRGNQKLIADHWAEAIPDGAALARFLEKLKLSRDVVSTPAADKPPEAPDEQISMAF